MIFAVDVSNRTINVIYSCGICVLSYSHNNRLYTPRNKSIWKMLIKKNIYTIYHRYLKIQLGNVNKKNVYKILEYKRIIMQQFSEK